MEHQRETQQPPLPPTPLKCPRCDSMDTKFCYYNNYRKEQPRHYCNTCKRNWTVGGKLRDIPVRGTSRKAKESKTASSSSSDNTRSRAPQTPSQPQGVVQTQNPLHMTQAPQPVPVASSQQLPVQFGYNQRHGNNGFGDASNNGTADVEAETTDFDVDQWLNIPDDLPSDECFSHAPK